MVFCLFVFCQDENDVYILTKVSDILHSVFSSYKEKVLPWFEQLLQLIVQLIVSPSCLWMTGKRMGHLLTLLISKLLCIWTDLYVFFCKTIAYLVYIGTSILS